MEREAGFTVHLPVDFYLFCGSAGTYNICPRSRPQLGTRKAETSTQLKPDVMATGNSGCGGQSPPQPLRRIAGGLEK